MTTTTHESNAPSTPNVAASSAVASGQTPPAAVSAYASRQTLRRTLISEWVKIRTLRNTWVLLAALVMLLVGLGALAAQVSTGSSDQGPGDGSPISTVLVGANFAVLLAGIMGSLAGAREFASRMITATVAAVPRRWQIVTSKTVVLAAVVVPTAIVGVLGAFFLGMMVLSGADAATVSLSDDGVLRTLLGMAGYIGAVALLGLALGILLRSVAASIGVLISVLVIVPALASSLLPSSWDSLLQYLPSAAASTFTEVMGASSSTLSAGAGALVLLAWVAATLGAATVVFTRRDV